MPEAVARSSIGRLADLASAASLADELGRAALAETCDACISSNQIHVVLDLVRVSLLDAKAIEIILEANARLTYPGGRFQFVNPLPLVKDILVANGIIEEESESGRDLNLPHCIGKRSTPLQRRKLGEIALVMGLLTQERLAETVRMHLATRCHLGQMLVEKKFLSEAERIGEAIHAQSRNGLAERASRCDRAQSRTKLHYVDWVPCRAVPRARSELAGGNVTRVIEARTQ